MSVIPKGFRAQTSLADMLTLPLTDFTAFRVVLYPTVTSAEFRKNFYRLLAHGKALSLNGKVPSLLASFFQCAEALPLLNTLGSMAAVEEGVAIPADSDVYESIIDFSCNEKEIIIRHAADTSNLDSDEKGLAIFVYTNLGNGLCRKYQLTWVPATPTRPSSLVIYYEQSNLRNLLIPYPQNANRDITQLINVASHYRPSDFDLPEDVAKETGAMAWAFYWDEELKPTFIHTYLSSVEKTYTVRHHARVNAPFDNFPVLNAVGAGWDINKYVDERCTSLLRKFCNDNGQELQGKFTSITGVNKSDGSIDYTLHEVQDGLTEELPATVNHLFSMCFMTPEVKRVTLTYTENKFTLILETQGLGVDNRPRTYFCEV